MDNEQYIVVFNGDLVEGYSLEQVKQEVSAKLNLSEKMQNRIFYSSGSSVVIKKALSKCKAEKYCEYFRKFGMLLTVAPFPTSSNNSAGELSRDAVNQKAASTLSDSAPISQLDKGIIRSDIDEVKYVPSRKEEFFDWFSYYKVALFFMLLGMTLVLVYFPFYDGYLRKGFLLGAVVLLFGFHSYRAN